MNYDFTRFDNKGGRTETRISITKSYDIGFPTAFYKQNSISEYKNAVLFFDSQRKAIAILFTKNPTEKGILVVSHDKKGRGARISATSFFKINNIDPRVYRGKYDWKIEEISEIGKVYIVELEKK